MMFNWTILALYIRFYIIYTCRFYSKVKFCSLDVFGLESCPESFKTPWNILAKTIFPDRITLIPLHKTACFPQKSRPSYLTAQKTTTHPSTDMSFWSGFRFEADVNVQTIPSSGVQTSQLITFSHITAYQRKVQQCNPRIITVYKARCFFVSSNILLDALCILIYI